uniref:C2 domain-containing protein n=1 Tax=Micrurus spixii TaxID=129469 RepID=A0A2D4M4U3_9SAUR
MIQKLNLSVWHNDPLGRNSFLGEMEIDLASWDWRNNKLNWYMLKPRSLSAINGVDHRGVMNLSIKYVPPGSLATCSQTPARKVTRKPELSRETPTPSSTTPLYMMDFTRRI